MLLGNQRPHGSRGQLPPNCRIRQVESIRTFHRTLQRYTMHICAQAIPRHQPYLSPPSPNPRATSPTVVSLDRHSFPPPCGRHRAAHPFPARPPSPQTILSPSHPYPFPAGLSPALRRRRPIHSNWFLTSPPMLIHSPPTLIHAQYPPDLPNDPLPHQGQPFPAS